MIHNHHHHHHRIHGSSASNHESRLCQAGHPFQYRRVSHLIITLTHSDSEEGNFNYSHITFINPVDDVSMHSRIHDLRDDSILENDDDDAA